MLGSRQTKEGETSEEQSQEHDHNFLRIKGIVRKEFFLFFVVVLPACNNNKEQAHTRNKRDERA
jgi:hypothetical protein